MSDERPSAGALTKVFQSLQDSDYRLPEACIHITNEGLGYGGFGDVKLATLHGEDHPRFVDGAKVAVKQLRPPRGEGRRKEFVFRCARELHVWVGLEHKNIVGLVGFYLSHDMRTAWIISTYEENGNIWDYLEHTIISESERIDLLVDATEGLAYLHDQNIYHGDIKAENVLVTGDRRAKLCDFGFAKVIQDAPSGLSTSNSPMGTTRYMAPEILAEDVFVRTLESDIWAWGCLFVEIMCALRPYADAKVDTAVLRKVIQRDLPATVEGLSMTDSFKDLLRRCWDYNPGLRPSI